MGAWEIFKDAIFAVINWFYGYTGDWGMAIILITILFRILIFPITRKQFKTSYKMQKMQPQIAAIREKYADDQPRQQQEMSKLYAEAKFNPLSGCLPMVLQMPIFIALFQVLQELPTRVGTVGVHFYGLIPDLTYAPSVMFAEQGVLAVIPYVLLVLLFGVSMLIPMLINKSSDKNTRIMMAVMAVMMIFFGWSAPAGVLLYWDASSLLGVAQQTIQQRLMKSKDDTEEALMVDVTPVKVDVDRKERKARPRRKK